jgi:carboxylesterase
MNDVRPGAEPSRYEGDTDVAVLLVHGFTGSTASMRPWAEYLHKNGYTVAVPRLPGHGTTWQDMEQTTWQDWYAAAEEVFEELASQYRRVFVGGLSMGGTLALRLAVQRGDEVAGVMVVNTGLQRPDRRDAPLLLAIDRLGLLGPLTNLVPTVPGIANDIKKPGQDEVAYDRVPIKSGIQLHKLQEDVRGDLPQVTQPLMVFMAPEDHTVDEANAGILMTETGSHRRTQILLPESYHVATLDNDAETIFAESLDFVLRHS